MRYTGEMGSSSATDFYCQLMRQTITVNKLLMTANSTRRMAIANGTCVSFCNQPKAQFGYLRRVTPVCRCLHPFCGWRHLVTSRECKGHFGLPWVRPCDNRGKCYMDRKRIQCWSNASQHIPIYLQPFTSCSEILVGNCNFFLPHCI